MVSCGVEVCAEMLTRRVRPAFHARLDLQAVQGRIYEWVIPDGTVARAITVPAVVIPFNPVVLLLLQTDSAMQVTLGSVAQNTPLALGAGGILALANVRLSPSTLASVTYTGGAGVPAHLVVALLSGFLLCPVWNAPWESPDLPATLCPVWDAPWES
jgi:hypothetical protein